MATHQLTTAPEVDPGDGIARPLPFASRDAFGTARAPVRVTIDEYPPIPSRVMVYSGVPWIGLRNEQVAEMDVAGGEPVRVRVELDHAPREVDVPAELAAALREAPEAAAAFEKLAFTHRKEYARCAVNRISRNRDNPATRRQRGPAMPESHQPQNFTTHTGRGQMAAKWAAKATFHTRSEQQWLLVQVISGAGGTFKASVPDDDR
jgi:hypothetical protein